MSLHTVAKHMAAKGRGPDSQLVHMSDREVAGLQALAKAHGGSLTVNPETGLAEAGILDNLLPAIVGAGLAYATGGASLGASIGLPALSNAAVIGGGLGLASLASGNSMKDALMTGLGAYGGAGLGSGLAATGAGPIPANAGAQVAPALTAPPSAGGLAGATTPESAALADQLGASGGRDALLARSVPEAQMAEQLAKTTTGAPSLADFVAENKALLAMGATPALAGLMSKTKGEAPAQDKGTIRPYKFAYNQQVPTNMVGTKYTPGVVEDTSERMWFNPQYTALPTYKAADGGLLDLTSNASYPMVDMVAPEYAVPFQTPGRASTAGANDVGVNPYTGEERGMAGGGISHLGDYSDGGRLLKGPGDGVSDSIPAQIGGKQPARLADGEFVVPARIVSELGNGSTDAGARQLYKMMDRVQKARGSTTGKNKVAKNTNAAKYLPA